MSKSQALIALARPRHWTKNAFVFMPVPFALAAGAELNPSVFLLGLFGFCLANSAVYAFNDAQDVEQDRLHPRKQRRPVASGAVSVGEARIFALLLAGAAAGVATLAGGRLPLTIVLAYLGLNFLYSIGAKNVALLDVFLLSSGFVIRVLLGCALISVSPSNWLLLCSSALALFLGLAKRRSDLAKGLGSDHRPSLAGYNLTFLDQAMGVSAAITIIAYALYSKEGGILLPGREFATLPFVVFGVLDYLRETHVKNTADFPVDLILRSPVLIACGVGWSVAAVWSVGLM